MGTVNIAAELAGIVNGLTNDATDVSGALTKIIAQLNGNIDLNNIKNAGLLTAVTHGDLSGSTNKLHSAGSVELSSAVQGHTDLDDAVQALDALVDPTELPTGAGNLFYIGYGYHATDYTEVSISIPADLVTSAIVVVMQCYLADPYTGGVVTVYVPLKINDVELSSTTSRDPRFHIFDSDNSSDGYVGRTKSKTCVINSSTYTDFSTVIQDDMTITFGTVTEAGDWATTDFELIVYIV